MYHKAPLFIDDQFHFQRDIESIRDSVDAFLELIIFTPRGGFKADYDFGFEFWSNEFQNLAIEDFNQHINETNLVNRKGDFTNQRQCIRELKKTIEFFEPRLKNVKIDMNLRQGEHIHNSLRSGNVDRTKYDVIITIRGEIRTDDNTMEGYRKQIMFTVGPAVKK